MITVVWAVVYLLEAMVKAYVIHAVGFDAAYTWVQIFPWAAIAVAVLATIGIARHYRAAGEQRSGDQ